ncbi:unnamed protein product [Closterium sp. Naga37s-1]|nr:unnamed protein product [Closterium sp. Naga37s-1]
MRQPRIDEHPLAHDGEKVRVVALLDALLFVSRQDAPIELWVGLWGMRRGGGGVAAASPLTNPHIPTPNQPPSFNLTPHFSRPLEPHPLPPFLPPHPCPTHSCLCPVLHTAASPPAPPSPPPTPHSSSRGRGEVGQWVVLCWRGSLLAGFSAGGVLCWCWFLVLAAGAGAGSWCWRLALVLVPGAGGWRWC